MGTLIEPLMNLCLLSIRPLSLNPDDLFLTSAFLPTQPKTLSNNGRSFAVIPVSSRV